MWWLALLKTETETKLTPAKLQNTQMDVKATICTFKLSTKAEIQQQDTQQYTQEDNIFPSIIPQGGFYPGKKTKQNKNAWCVVLLASLRVIATGPPPCWWDGCRYKMRWEACEAGGPPPPPFATVFSHLCCFPAGSCASPGRWARRRSGVSFERRWKSGATSRRSPSPRSTAGRPTFASTSRGGGGGGGVEWVSFNSTQHFREP